MKEHVYNSIPHQSLTHANQLTLKLWNDYINQLRTQTNKLTTNEETLYRWLFSEYDLSSFVFGEKSFVEYVIDNIVSHTSTLDAHGETLNTHKNRLDSLDDEIVKIKEGPTSVYQAINYETENKGSSNISAKFAQHENSINLHTQQLIQYFSDLSKHENKLLDLETSIKYLKQHGIETDNRTNPVWRSEDIGKVFLNISSGPSKGLIYCVSTDSSRPFIYLSMSLNDLNNLSTNVNTLNSSKLNKIFSDNLATGIIGDNYYFSLYSGNTAYKISWEDLRKTINEGDHFKGDYVTFEQLLSNVTDPKDGDYAYVESGNNEMILYIWDADASNWRMSTASQFLKESVFTAFQQGVLEGSIIAGCAKDYDSEGAIAKKFKQLEQGNITFSGALEDTQAPIVKQITVGDTIWQVKASDPSTTFSIIYNLVVNVNNMQFPDVKFIEFTYGNYSGKRMVTNDSNETIINDPAVLKAYMKFMTGNDYIPVYKSDEPLNVYLVTFDGIIYKMQYITDLGLCAFYMRKVATQNYVDEKVGNINSILATLVTVEE